jgi:hypothetical protein
MDNVLNRPLFRHREARDRLNESVGVQRFNVGGGVFANPSGAIDRPTAQGMPIIPLQLIRPAGLPSALAVATGQENPELYGRAASGMVKSAETNLAVRRRRFEQDRTEENYQAILEAEQDLEEAITQAQALGETSEQIAQPEPLPPALRDLPPGPFVGRDESMGEGPEAAVSRMTPEELDIFNERYARAADRAAPEVLAPSGVGGARPEGRAAGLPAAGTGVQPAAPAGPSTMEADARGRGPLITNPLEVAAGLNAEDPAARERTLSDFMKEFTDAAPKYEGADKNLMLAQIGFAIAAGESPNAMQNIANGLLAGSDMMLKDKAAKSEFDRQLRLSAMQYGLEGVGKQRTRAEAPLTFVALEDTTYKGRKVRAGDEVYIPYGEIEKNGGVVPSGFGDSSTVTAINERAKAITDTLEKARQENLLDDTFAESQREKFSRAASTAISAERGLGYMEAAILKVAEEGNITGLAGTKDDLVAKVAAAAGLDDVNAQFNSREEVQGLVRKAFQNLIPAALSGVQTANSISNRDIEILADAYVNSMLKDGVFSMATITEDKLLNSMKGAVDLLESERQQSMVDMRTIEGTIVGRTLRSGAEATSLIEPYRDLLPGRGGASQPRRLGSLVYGEDGVYEIMKPGA